MEVSYIPASCWCGATGYIEYFRGNWNNEVNAILGSCENCGMIRTIEADSVTILDYTEKGTYVEGLSLRHKNSLRTIYKFIKPGNLIDIGCSQGSIIHEVKKNKPGTEVYGIDLNQNAINSPVANDIRIEYKKLEDVGETFDNILALHVLEHIPDYGEFFRQIQRISKPGAIMYCALPNINSYHARHSLPSWGALNPSQHSWHFSKQSFARLFRQFLPEAEILELKTSWIWPFGWKRFYRNLMFEGDQVEIVVRIKN